MSLRRAVVAAATAGIAFGLLPATAGAASLQFDGAGQNPGSKEISSYSWGLSQTGSFGTGGGGGAGKAKFQNMTVTSSPSTNSPNFSNRVGTGKTVSRAQVYSDDNVGSAYCMENVIFTEYSVSGGSEGQGQETISMAYRKMHHVVFFDGGVLVASFDLATSKFSISSSNPCPGND
jgi:type VI secretion system secreted protein Hcp